jgi:hypothetical protein
LRTSVFRAVRRIAAALTAVMLAGCGGPTGEPVVKIDPADLLSEEQRGGALGKPGDQTGDTAQAGPGLIVSDANRARLDAFVRGAALFTLYHELGHFVMSEYKVRNPGGNEIAADRFAALVMTPPPVSNPKREMFDPASSADVPPVLWAIAWLRNFQQQAERNGAIDMADEHGLPEQRMRQVLCLIYGADPARWSTQSVFTTNLSEEKRQFCLNDTQENAAVWAHYLTDRLADDGDQKVYKAVITYEDAPPELAVYRQWLITSGLLEEIGAEIGRLKWAASVSEYSSLGSLTNQPLSEINVIGSSCQQGDSYIQNAFWSPSKRSLVLCYGMIKYFDGFATEVLGNMPATTQTTPLGR